VRPAFSRLAIAAAAVVVATAWTSVPARQHTSDAEKPYWRRNIFRRIGSDQSYLFRSWLPVEIRRQGFSVPLFTSTAIAIVGSFGNPSEGIDGRLEYAIYSNAGPRAQSAANAFTSLGNSPVVLAILGVTYLAGHIGHDDRLAEASSLAVESFADAGIWNVVLKAVAARVRPGEPNEAEFLQYGAAQNQSFPSGHAMIAFSVASVFAEEYRDRRWVGGLAYGTATLIALSRVVLGRHFPADVIAGGVLGSSFGHMVVTRSRQARGENVSPAQSFYGLAPFYDPIRRGYGIGWSSSW